MYSLLTHFNAVIELSQTILMIAAEVSTANMGRPQIHGISIPWAVVGSLIAAWDLLFFGIQGKVNYGTSYCFKWLQWPQSSTQTSFDLGTALLLCSACFDSSVLSLQPHNQTFLLHRRDALTKRVTLALYESNVGLHQPTSIHDLIRQSVLRKHCCLSGQICASDRTSHDMVSMSMHHTPSWLCLG